MDVVFSSLLSERQRVMQILKQVKAHICDAQVGFSFFIPECHLSAMTRPRSFRESLLSTLTEAIRGTLSRGPEPSPGKTLNGSSASFKERTNPLDFKLKHCASPFQPFTYKISLPTYFFVTRKFPGS